MKYKDRAGNITIKSSFQEKVINSVYSNTIGRFVLKGATNPKVSEFFSNALNSKTSRIIINPFIRSNGIDMNEYEYKCFESYNDFFIRQIKEQNRPINMDKNAFISPCDGKVTVYNIDSNLCFKIKGSFYNVATLLNSFKLAEEFSGGICVVIRLSVDNYHRYCYLDNAKKGANIFIPGKLHTVNPIAFEHFQIFKENSREYCILDTENFGKVVQIEVGAMMVGKIINYHGCKTVEKGEEKGRFEFGGSTVVLLLKKDAIVLDNDIVKNSFDDFETIVKMGEKIGTRFI